MSTSSAEAMQYEEEEEAQNSPMQGSEAENIIEDDENMAKLKHVASTGSMSPFEWLELKSIVHSRLINIINRYVEQIKSELVRVQLETSNMPVTPIHTSSTTDNNSTLGDAESFINDIKREEENLSKIVHEMCEPPFTIQRICELLYEPTRYYDKGDKFVRAIEKNLRVVSPHEEPKQQQHRQQLLPLQQQQQPHHHQQQQREDEQQQLHMPEIE